MSHGQFHQIGIVETGSSRRMLMKECQGDDRDKQQQAPGLREQEEFERGGPAMRVAQMAIRRYMGINMSSQKKKNKNRSIAKNTPMTPPMASRTLL